MFCWLRQWRISSALDDGRDVPAGLRRHVMRCDRCRAFLEGSQRFGSVLRDEATSVDEPLSPTPAWRHWAPAAAAILIAVAGLWMWLDSRAPRTSAPSSSPPLIAETSPLEKLDAPLTIPRDLADRSLAMIQELSGKPMRREMDGLSRDAEAVADALLSYLPRMP